MGVIRSALGAIIAPILVPQSYWAVKTQGGRFYTELDTIHDIRFEGGYRAFDWTLDVVGAGDHSRITELWLFCPPHKNNPLGSTATLPITEKGTAFQFKLGLVMGITESMRVTESQIIGRVNNKETGDCVCFIWDAQLERMSEPWYSNIYRFGAWREGVVPLSSLAQDVVGLRLG